MFRWARTFHFMIWRTADGPWVAIVLNADDHPLALRHMDMMQRIGLMPRLTEVRYQITVESSWFGLRHKYLVFKIDE